MLEKVIDLACDISIEAGRDKFSEIKDEKRLRSIISEYLASQTKINECANLAEEIDFEGLVDYCKTDGFKALMQQRVCGNSTKQRGIARMSVITMEDFQTLFRPGALRTLWNWRL